MRIREDLQQVWAPDSPPRSPVWTMDRIGVSFLDPLDDYELIHRIGSGTYGDVFKVSESPSHRVIWLWTPPTDSELMSKRRLNCHRCSLPVCRGGDVGLLQPGCHCYIWRTKVQLFFDGFSAMRSAVWCRISCWSLGLAELRALRCISGARCLPHLVASAWKMTANVQNVKAGLSRE